MSYTADKYGEDYDFPDVPLTVPVSEEVETLLKVYLEGVRDADAMLGRLRDYFVARQEPVVLVFFGDHLPYLGDSQLGYQELGMTEDPTWNQLNSYATPYVIWANDAAAEALDWENAVAALDLPQEPSDLSAAFLGAAVLELTGRTGESPWFDFLNSLRRMAPVIQKDACLLSDGTLVSQTDLDADESAESAELRAAVDQWRNWSYYHLRYQDIP